MYIWRKYLKYIFHLIVELYIIDTIRFFIYMHVLIYNFSLVFFQFVFLARKMIWKTGSWIFVCTFFFFWHHRFIFILRDFYDIMLYFCSHMFLLVKLYATKLWDLFYFTHTSYSFMIGRNLILCFLLCYLYVQSHL